MKKLMSLLLAVIMMMTIIMIPVSAADANEEDSYVAPVFYGTQKRTNANETIDVRFVAVTDSLVGAKLGYEITAYWWDATSKTYKEKVYSVAEGNPELEASTIYASVEAGESTVTAAELGEELGMVDARGIFAVAINGVPASIEVLFSVKTYVKNSAGEIAAENEAKEVIYANGQRSADKIVYFNNFNDASFNLTYSEEGKDNWNTTLTEQIGWTSEAYGCTDGMTAKAEDGKVNFTQSHDSLTRGLTILGANSINSASAFKFSADVQIDALGLVDFALGSYYKSREIASAQIRAYSEETMQSVAANSTETTDVGINAFISKADITASANVADYGETFRLTIAVDLLESTMTIYADNVQVYNGKYTGALDGGLCLLLRNTDITLDNMLITATPYVASEKILYNNNFDSLNLDLTYAGNADYYESLETNLGWTLNQRLKDGKYSDFYVANGCSVKSNDGAIKIHNIDDNPRGYTILSTGTISANASSFTISMDISIEQIGLFEIVLGSRYEHRDIASVQFRGYSVATRDGTILSADTAHSTTETYLGIVSRMNKTNSHTSFAPEGTAYGEKITLSITVNNNTVTITANGVVISEKTYTGTLDGGVCILADNATATIDNLKITAVQ